MLYDNDYCCEDCYTCQCHLIERVRVDEREKPLNAIPRAICNSESFMWLMVGSNHPEVQLKTLRAAWVVLRDEGGGWGRL
jgi:hypothetical protein